MMGLHLRYMEPGDIPEVVELDRQSFDMPWSARSYLFEVAESTYSHMVVLENTPDSNTGGMSRLWRRSVQPPAQHSLYAFGGLWFIAGEAHISTIASAPLHRGRGWGEVALAGMVRRSITLGASHVVLEVRLSNFVAQRLYSKYGFLTVGIKPHYYSNNGEDAYDMRLELLNNPGYEARFEERWDALQSRKHFEDSYTEGTPPR